MREEMVGFRQWGKEAREVSLRSLRPGRVSVFPKNWARMEGVGSSTDMARRDATAHMCVMREACVGMKYWSRRNRNWDAVSMSPMMRAEMAFMSRGVGIPEAAMMRFATSSMRR